MRLKLQSRFLFMLYSRFIFRCNSGILQHSLIRGIWFIRGISDFWISGESIIKENCNKSRTRNDINIRFGPVTKIHKKNKTISEKFDDDVMPKNYDVLVIFTISVNLEQSGSRIPDI